MLISKGYSGIYVKEQLFYLLFSVEISNALKNLTQNPKAFQESFVMDQYVLGLVLGSTK